MEKVNFRPNAYIGFNVKTAEKRVIAAIKELEQYYRIKPRPTMPSDLFGLSPLDIKKAYNSTMPVDKEIKEAHKNWIWGSPGSVEQVELENRNKIKSLIAVMYTAEKLNAVYEVGLIKAWLKEEYEIDEDFLRKYAEGKISHNELNAKANPGEGPTPSMRDPGRVKGGAEW